jgi:spore maturation protein CgeB
MSAYADGLDIVVLGLSITSSWGNGHATTYRGLVRELESRGHRVLFLERDRPWYADNRDMPHPPFGRTVLYGGLGELRIEHADAVRDADLVIVGSYVPDGIAVGEWVTRTARGATAFYDIDTPVTLATLATGACEYLTTELVGRYDMYLSFTGGPTLDRIEQKLGSPMARPLYCSVDERLYFAEPRPVRWHLGYMGTYSDDRQPAVERLLLSVAREWKEASFIAVGPQYPDGIAWPPNIRRVTHLAPRHHRAFYNEQRFTLNITRAAMIAAGWSPSVRLFEAAACGTPIITDDWNGLDSFFTRDEEILVATSTAEVLRMLQDLPEAERLAIGARARRRVLSEHTAAHRAAELESYAYELLGAPRGAIA